MHSRIPGALAPSDRSTLLRSASHHALAGAAPSHSNLDEIFTRAELAALLKVSERTLEDHALRGTGPLMLSLGQRRIGYRWRDVLAWMETRTVRSTSEATVRRAQRERAA